MRSLYLAVCVALTYNTFGQSNIVINNSFESSYNYDSIRSGKSFNWSFLEDYSPGKNEWGHFYRINSDLFDPVPNNTVGYQKPQDGNSYAGFGVYDKNFEFREYLIGTLSQPLKKDKSYRISFYLNLANCSQYAINSIGVSFSNEVFLYAHSKRHYAILKELPVYFEYSGEVLTDTSSWVKIEGEFKANGLEDKIIIGCFKTDDDLVIKRVKCSRCKGKDISLRETGYYLIDNIVLRKKDE